MPIFCKIMHWCLFLDNRHKKIVFEDEKKVRIGRRKDILEKNQPNKQKVEASRDERRG